VSLKTWLILFFVVLLIAGLTGALPSGGGGIP
jgi:hypothetical protein